MDSIIGDLQLTILLSFLLTEAYFISVKWLALLKTHEKCECTDDPLASTDIVLYTTSRRVMFDHSFRGE